MGNTTWTLAGLIVPWSLWLLLVAFGMVLAFVAKRRWASREPRCGACDYSVRGATGFVCPECGGDYRVQGIIAGALHRASPLLLWLVVWTLSAPYLAAVLESRVAKLFPQIHVRNDSETYSGQSGYSDVSDVTFAITGERSSWPWESPPSARETMRDLEVSVIIRPDRPRLTIHIDPNTLTPRDGAIERVPVTADSLDTWLRPNVEDLARDPLGTFAAALAKYIATICETGEFAPMPGTNPLQFNSRNVRQMSPASSFLFYSKPWIRDVHLVTVWLIGLVALWLLHRFVRPSRTASPLDALPSSMDSTQIDARLGDEA